MCSCDRRCFRRHDLILRPPCGFDRCTANMAVRRTHRLPKPWRRRKMPSGFQRPMSGNQNRRHISYGRGRAAWRWPGCDPCGPRRRNGQNQGYMGGTSMDRGGVVPEQRLRCDFLRFSREIWHTLPSINQSPPDRAQAGLPKTVKTPLDRSCRGLGDGSRRGLRERSRLDTGPGRAQRPDRHAPSCGRCTDEREMMPLRDTEVGFCRCCPRAYRGRLGPAWRPARALVPTEALS